MILKLATLSRTFYLRNENSSFFAVASLFSFWGAVFPEFQIVLNLVRLKPDLHFNQSLSKYVVTKIQWWHHFFAKFPGVISSIAWWRGFLWLMRWQKASNQSLSFALSCRYFMTCQGCTLMSTFLVQCVASIIMSSNKPPMLLSFDTRVSYSFDNLLESKLAWVQACYGPWSQGIQNLQP